jgi:hypothetical protein
MLDLSAAFDTIDHPTLLSRLQSTIGLSGKAFEWFSSYISGRKQSIIINGIQSSIWELLFGVPQGSVLGPLLFIIYMSPLGKILQSLGVQYHFYADDSQIYISFDVIETEEAITKIEETVAAIKKWMSQNFLCLNDEKTEVLFIASKSVHQRLDIPGISIGNVKISPTHDAKNIGFVFDDIMSSQKQVNITCRSGWYHLRNIGKICQYLDSKSIECLVHAFITSKLDINNSLLYGLPDTLLNKLQVLQNSAARLVRRLLKHNHVTPLLRELHWLPVKQRIKFKVLLLVFKALNNLAPAYIQELLVVKPESARSLRSDNKNLLVVPRS